MDPEIHQKFVDARLKALEAEVRRLRAALGWPPEEPLSSAEEAASSAGAPPEPHAAALDPGPSPARPTPSVEERPTRDLERWFGENALLVAGLLALVATAGFLFKYAFDQGWVSPALRVLSGIVTGLGLCMYGVHTQRRGLSRFGGALVGGGGAIAYLSVWGAAGPYQFVSTPIGIACLAVISGLLVLRAIASDTEYLAGLAAVGAFMAPLILAAPETSLHVLLLYCAVVAGASGYAGLSRGWPVTFGVVALGFFVVPVAATLATNSASFTIYVVVGGALGMWFAQGRGWPSVLALVFALAWPSLALHAIDISGWPAWLLVVLAPALAAPTLLDFLGNPRASADSSDRSVRARLRAPAFLDKLRDEWWGYLLLSALAWSGVTILARPGLVGDYPLAALGLVALPYLWVARSRSSAGSAAIGVAVLAWGCAQQFDEVALAASWAGLAVLSALFTRARPLAAARWMGLLLSAFAAGRLFGADIAVRTGAEPAFFGPWSLALYAVIATFALLAGPLWGERPTEAAESDRRLLRRWLWIGAGLVLLVGGTQEIVFYFGQTIQGANALARDLTVSAFWLLYAAALLSYGFWRDMRAVRIAGLVVTTLAILKVILNDLTALEALYRVAALGLTAVIALVGAGAYHRRSRQIDATPQDPTP